MIRLVRRPQARRSPAFPDVRITTRCGQRIFTSRAKSIPSMTRKARYRRKSWSRPACARAWLQAPLLPFVPIPVGLPAKGWFWSRETQSIAFFNPPGMLKAVRGADGIGERVDRRREAGRVLDVGVVERKVGKGGSQFDGHAVRRKRRQQPLHHGVEGPLRSEPQIERTFKMAMIISSLSSSIKGLRQLRERFSDRARDSLRVDPTAPSRAHPRTRAAG
jgi:hypothetical protein